MRNVLIFPLNWQFPVQPLLQDGPFFADFCDLPIFCPIQNMKVGEKRRKNVISPEDISIQPGSSAFFASTFRQFFSFCQIDFFLPYYFPRLNFGKECKIFSKRSKYNGHWYNFSTKISTLILNGNKNILHLSSGASCWHNNFYYPARFITEI